MVGEQCHTQRRLGGYAGGIITEGGTVLDENGLTPKMKAFCEEYIANGGNATQAALKAGYKDKTAYSIGAENLKKPQVLDYIKKLTTPKEAQRIASADEVLEYLTMVVDAKRKELKGEGPEIVKTADANKAADLLGKFHQLYVERIKVDEDSAITIKVVDYE